MVQEPVRPLSYEVLLTEVIRNLSVDAGVVTTPAKVSGNTLTDETKNWAVGVHKNRSVKIVSGSGEGQLRVVDGNTDKTLVLKTTWVKPLDTTSAYVILEKDSAQILREVLNAGYDISAAHPLETHDPTIDDIEVKLDHPDHGLAALKAAISSLAGGAFYGSYGPRNVEVGNDVDFGQVLYDPSGNVITVGEITPGTYTIRRVRAAVDTEIVASTPSSEAAGRVYTTYNFPAGWNVGDIFYITFSGITVTIDGTATEYPNLFIWGRVVREADISAKVDDLQADIGDASASVLGSLLAILGNPSISLTSKINHVPKFTGNLWWASTAGDDADDGRSPEMAFLTIAHAIGAAAAGDRIYVKAGTYDEALNMNLTGLELVCEQGTILVNTTPGTPLIVSADYCRVVGATLLQALQTGLQVTGDFCSIEDCLAYACDTGFDDDGLETHFKNCRSIEHTATGFDISAGFGQYERCIATTNQVLTTGFDLSAGTADHNHFLNCHTLGNATAGWNVVAGADNNLFSGCSTGAGDGAKIDNGANNTWDDFSEGSQIVVGQTRDQDLKDIYDRIGGAPTENTYSLPNDTVENSAFTITPTGAQRITLILDLSNLVQNADIRVKYDMHGGGAPFPTMETFNWTTGMDDIVYFREISGQRAVEVTVQSLVAQGAAKDIDYEYVLG